MWQQHPWDSPILLHSAVPHCFLCLNKSCKRAQGPCRHGGDLPQSLSLGGEGTGELQTPGWGPREVRVKLCNSQPLPSVWKGASPTGNDPHFPSSWHPTVINPWLLDMGWAAGGTPRRKSFGLLYCAPTWTASTPTATQGLALLLCGAGGDASLLPGSRRSWDGWGRGDLCLESMEEAAPNVVFM